MESCFPPLASLSLRGNSANSATAANGKHQKNRHSLGGGLTANGTSLGNGTNNNSSTATGVAAGEQNSSDYLPKLDVIQDLDLYYIRQIACSLKELDLEQKIDLEIKMREGSAKLLAACNNTRNSTKTLSFSNGLNSQSAASAYNTQILEAAKNLLTSNERMTAYMSELQRRKRDKEGTQLRSKPTGKISLSEIRMPLMWRDSDHFKNKGDHRRFAVFCLAKIGTEIFDTTLLCPIDRNSTDISFSDSIIFSNVTPDFELTLEVYAVMMEQDLSIASTPRKIKNTIHSSISRTVGKRLAANLKDELNNTKIGPKFALIATATLSLAEASDLPHTHDLRLIQQTVVSNTGAPAPPQGTNQALPLFGHFCCRLAVQPDSFDVAAIADELAGLEAKAQNFSLDSCYAKLQAFRLDVWDSEKAFNNNLEVKRSIAINRDTKLKHRGDNDLNVINMEDGNVVEYLLKTSSVTQQTQFYAAIKKVINEHKLWGHVVQHGPMELASQPESKGYFLRTNRQRSLYDQVPILNPQDSNSDLTSLTLSSKHESIRPSVQDIFAVPSSPTEFRHRTYSSSRSTSNGSSISINSKKSWFTGK